MNAAAKALAYGNVFKGDFSNCLATFSQKITCFLVLILIVSALAVVYVRNVEREWTGREAVLSEQLNKQEVQQDQLLLERSMWSSPTRIRQKAQDLMDMTVIQEVHPLVLADDLL